MLIWVQCCIKNEAYDWSLVNRDSSNDRRRTQKRSEEVHAPFNNIGLITLKKCALNNYRKFLISPIWRCINYPSCTEPRLHSKRTLIFFLILMECKVQQIFTKRPETCQSCLSLSNLVLVL